MMVLDIKSCDGDVFKILQRNGRVEVVVGIVRMPGKKMWVLLGPAGKVGFCLGCGTGSGCA